MSSSAYMDGTEAKIFIVFGHIFPALSMTWSYIA